MSLPIPAARAPRILVLGRTGQIGHDLASTLAPLGQLHATGRDEVDFLRPETISAAVRAHLPDVIVNAVAYTAVDKAESDPATAEMVNVRGVEVLAAAARGVGAAIVHYSTDYVFDGETAEARLESHPTAPLNTYGATKLRGEQALASADVPYLVLRTSWVYATRGSNFARTILNAARTREELAVVDDQRGAPTWSLAVAATTAAMLARGTEDLTGFIQQHRGVYHLTAGGQTTWYGFARALLDGDPRRDEHRVKELRPIPSSGYPTPAARPRNSVLSNAKIRDVFGLRQTSWEDQLRLALASRNFV